MSFPRRIIVEYLAPATLTVHVAVPRIEVILSGDRVYRGRISIPPLPVIPTPTDATVLHTPATVRFISRGTYIQVVAQGEIPHGRAKGVGRASGTQTSADSIQRMETANLLFRSPGILVDSLKDPYSTRSFAIGKATGLFVTAITGFLALVQSSIGRGRAVGTLVTVLAQSQLLKSRSLGRATGSFVSAISGAIASLQVSKGVSRVRGSSIATTTQSLLHRSVSRGRATGSFILATSSAIVSHLVSRGQGKTNGGTILSSVQSLVQRSAAVGRATGSFISTISTALSSLHSAKGLGKSNGASVQATAQSLIQRSMVRGRATGSFVSTLSVALSLIGVAKGVGRNRGISVQVIAQSLIQRSAAIGRATGSFVATASAALSSLHSAKGVGKSYGVSTISTTLSTLSRSLASGRARGSSVSAASSASASLSLSRVLGEAKGGVTVNGVSGNLVSLSRGIGLSRGTAVAGVPPSGGTTILMQDLFDGTGLVNGRVPDTVNPGSNWVTTTSPVGSNSVSDGVATVLSAIGDMCHIQWTPSTPPTRWRFTTTCRSPNGNTVRICVNSIGTNSQLLISWLNTGALQTNYRLNGATTQILGQTGTFGYNGMVFHRFVLEFDPALPTNQQFTLRIYDSVTDELLITLTNTAQPVPAALTTFGGCGFRHAGNSGLEIQDATLETY